MTVADPEWKTVWSGEVVWRYLGNRWNMWQPGDGKLNLGGRDNEYKCQRNSGQNGGSNPNPKATIIGVMHRGMRRVE
jgi:hypothetical protein